MKNLVFITLVAILFAACAKEDTAIAYTGPQYKYRVEAGVNVLGSQLNWLIYTNHLKYLGGDCYEVVAHRDMPDIYVKAGDTITLCKVLLIKKQ